MQKWEYVVGSFPADVSNERRVDALNDWGRHGWELVSEVLLPDCWLWTFKRPKEST